MKRFAVIAVAGCAVAGCGSSGTPVSAPAQPHRLQYPVVISPVVHAPRPRPIPDVICNCSLVISPPMKRWKIVVHSEATLVSPTRLRIVTLGSSSCPSVPDEVVAENRDTLRIHLVTGTRTRNGLVAHPPPSGICTTDFGTTPMVVAIDPTLIDVHRPLTVRFFYRDSKKPEVRTAARLKR
jgi:hypothetical protein